MDVGIDDMAKANGHLKEPRVIKFGGTSVTGGDRVDTIAGVCQLYCVNGNTL